MMTRWISIFMLMLIGCVQAVKIDANEKTITPPPSVIYNPSALQIPTPTDLVLNATTGKLNIPQQGPESPLVTQLRTQGFNQLDGYSTVLPPIEINFTAPIDAASLAGHVFLYRIETDGVPSDPTVEAPVALGVALAKPTELVGQPAAPLAGHSVYAVVLTQGITSNGVAIETSGTFALLRQSTAPATVDAQGNVLTNNLPFDPSVPSQLATIQQFDALWAGTAPLLQYLDIALPKVVSAYDRTQLVLAYPFHTQSISQALDQKVPGSAAAQLLNESAALLPGAVVHSGSAEVTSFVEGLFGAGTCGTTVPCDEIGTIREETFHSPNFQPLVNTIPGAWSDPIAPTKVNDATLKMLVVLPASPGSDTVVFGHGLGRRKEDMLYIAGELAFAGITTVAIDWVASGDRALPDPTMSTAPACDPSQAPTYLTAPQCFAPIFSTDLLATRDNFRQSVIDAEQEVRVVQACAAGPSCPWKADHIGYVGQSLGGLLGVMVAAMTPGITASVSDVGGAGWIDLATLTPDLGIKCSIVNGLITAGILTGTLWTGSNTDALCETTTWLSDPNFLAFRSAAQWILDPADGLNYAARFAQGQAGKILLQEVQNDQTVPNQVQNNFGALASLNKTTASAVLPLVASSAAGATTNAWIEYDSDSNFSYSHGSLTQAAAPPAVPSAAEDNAHNQLIADVVAYLQANL
jgi:dienelactone hydrolase